MVSKSTPIVREKVLAQGKDVKFSKRLFQNIDIKTQLQYVGLEENFTTLEVYKQLWLLLVVDPQIVVKVDNPEKVKSRSQFSIFNDTGPLSPTSAAKTLTN